MTDEENPNIEEKKIEDEETSAEIPKEESVDNPVEDVEIVPVEETDENLPVFGRNWIGFCKKGLNFFGDQYP